MKKNVIIMVVAGFIVGLISFNYFSSQKEVIKSAKDAPEIQSHSEGEEKVHDHSKKNGNLSSSKIVDNDTPSEASLPENSIDMSDIFKNLPHSKKIVSYMNQIEMIGEDSEVKIQAYLNEMKEKPVEFTKSLIDGYKKMPRQMYTERWYAIHTIGELSDASSYEYLLQVTMEKMPQEGSEDTHHFSTVKEETLIKTAAISGIGNLSAQGNKSAETYLLQVASTSTDLNILRSSIGAYLKGEEQSVEKVDRLKKVVDKQYHDLITYKTTDVSTIQDKQFEKDFSESEKASLALKQQYEKDTQEALGESKGQAPESIE